MRFCIFAVFAITLSSSSRVLRDVSTAGMIVVGHQLMLRRDFGCSR